MFRCPHLSPLRGAAEEIAGSCCPSGSAVEHPGLDFALGGRLPEHTDKIPSACWAAQGFSLARNSNLEYRCYITKATPGGIAFVIHKSCVKENED